MTNDATSSDEDIPGGCPHGFAAEYNFFAVATLRDPYPVYDCARHEAPVFFSPSLGAWVVSRYDDVCAILKDNQRFSSENLFAAATEFTPEALALLGTGYPNMSTPLDSDPPRHNRLRRFVSRAFAPKRVEAVRPVIRNFASELIDGFAKKGRADIVARLALPLPLRVILHVVGVPDADQAKIKQWCDDWFSLLFTRVPPERQIACVESALAYQRYVAELIHERRKSPREDALSDLLAASDEGDNPLSVAELISIVGGSFIAAGHETTTSMLTNALLVLLSDTARWEALKADPSLIPRYLEEAMRLDSTSNGFLRTAKEPVEIAGVKLPAGARVYLLYGSACRDGAHFSSPERFDPARENLSDQLTFGRGIHYCAGAPLARAEAQITIDLLRERLPGLRLVPDQELRYLPHLAIRGPIHLWVEWDG
jgi:cytochrome P450